MIKVVVIGAGDIGAQAYEYIGADLVECFVDNYKAGNIYCGKNVLPMEKLPELSKGRVLLLAVTNYAEELTRQLEEMGIVDFYYFREEIYRGNILQELGIEQNFIKKSIYEVSRELGTKRACVYGNKRKIGLFLSDIFENLDLYEELKEDAGQEQYEGLFENLQNQYDYILINSEDLTPELQGTIKKANANKIKYIAKFYDSKSYFLQNICRYKNKYKGKRCFIIGNGPSLTVSDLDKLADNHEICFGLNVIHKIYPKTRWRPDFLCASDVLVIKQNYRDMIKNNACPKFISDIVSLFCADEREDVCLFHELHISKDELRTPDFAFDIENGIFNGSTVTYIVFQICVYMGFDEIYLLGMDCGNWNKHFCADYWSKEEQISLANDERIKRGYEEAERISRENGFRIYNATRGGFLEAFERVDFDRIFEEII